MDVIFRSGNLQSLDQPRLVLLGILQLCDLGCTEILMVHKQWQLSDDRIQVDIHEMNGEPEDLRDIEPRETAVGGDELEVVEVDVHVDGLVTSKVHVVVVVRNLLMGGD